MKYRVLIDAGHGGLDALGNYHSIAHGKKYKHQGYTFHGNGFFYEGVFNRQMASKVSSELKKLGIQSVTISDEILDFSLSDRVKKVNHYHRKYKGKTFLLSLHANASPRHNARGYEVFTSKGETWSDTLASLHFHHVKILLGDQIRMRHDTYSDGDVDKEAGFHILKRTHCPAILIEHLFFDQIDDAKLLNDKMIQEKFAIATALACSDFISYLNDE